jgi:biopolymer transport protein ExbD
VKKLKFRPLSKVGAFVPTTSMADVAFLLIIFFMVSAEFSVRKGMMFSFPSTRSAGEASEATQPVLLAIDAGGRLQIDGVAANLEDVRRLLVPKLEVHPNQWIVLRASGETAYGRLVEVLGQLKAIGVKNISLPGLTIPPVTPGSKGP